MDSSKATDRQTVRRGGGFEQSRSDYSGASVDNPDQASVKKRAYSFAKNPYKFYAFGTNGMLNITYKF